MLCEQNDVVLVVSMDVLAQFIVNAMLWWYLTEGNGWISLMFKPWLMVIFYIYSRFTWGFFALTPYINCSKIKVCCKPVSWLKLTSPILFQRRDAGIMNYILYSFEMLTCCCVGFILVFSSEGLREYRAVTRAAQQQKNETVDRGGDHTLRTSEKLTWLGRKYIFD